MKNTYLALAVVGFLIPNYLVLRESISTGNIMLYADPVATFSGMFANPISTIFGVDLLLAVATFFVWTGVEGRRLGIPRIPLLWLATMLLGLAATLPFYLYLREGRTEVA